MTYRKQKGFTLIDVLFSVVLLIVAISGAMQYRYHAALGVRKARMQTGAAELALMLVETWRGVDGADTFDSESHFSSALAINSSTGPACPADYNDIGSYAIQWSDYNYTATLSSRDIGNGLRSLNVIVAWPFGNSNTDKEYRITSYVDTN
jgi:type II secretory pathway pseudopilin PulG